MTVTSPRLEITLQSMPDESRVTTYMIAVAIGGRVIWPVYDEPQAAFEGQIDDLLAHLTEFWKPLMLRQVYPIDVAPLRPSDLRREAARRWAEIQPAIVEKEEEAVSAFEEAHDLARAFAGVFGLPQLWIMRSGESTIVETAGHVWRPRFEEVRRCLSAVGDEICKRLASVSDGRWDDAIDAWKRRADSDQTNLLAWSAGLDRALAHDLIVSGALSPPSNFDDAANDNDELRIAARIAGALPAEQIRQIIGLACDFGSCGSNDLRRLATDSSDHIAQRFAAFRPFVQGEAAARYVREQLHVVNGTMVDVFAMAATLGITVRSCRAEPSTLDGLAIWGERHGPGVFLNEASLRILPRGGQVKDSPSARVTLAHELCHLLLDGGHALSAVEVLKARMPVGVEQRAKSFAGEFLLPTRDAASVWIGMGRPSTGPGIENVVVALTDDFLVTRSVAAWKIEHAAALEGVDLSAVLDAVVRYR
jgi:hypothetical protein